jgi:outer membrane protein, multidrug efflux system
MLKPKHLITGLAIFTIIGCEVGPNYKPPEVKVQPAFAEAKMPTTAPTTQASVPTSGEHKEPIYKWWTTFHDDEMESLVQRAVHQNYTLAEAASRMRQARYQRSVIGSALYPTINANGGYQHARGSSNVEIPAGAFGGGGGSSNAATVSPNSVGRGQVAKPAQQVAGNSASINNPPPGGPQSPLGSGGLPGVDTDLYQIGFDATWEIDVFGGQRRAVEGADADWAAAQETARDTLVSLVAETARTYIELRGYQRQYAIAQENLAAQQDTLDLTESKFKAGFVTQLDVARQATQVATTAADLPSLEAQIRISIHTLSVLLGEDPDALADELIKPGQIPPVPPEIPIGMPSTLLQRRPDVRRAERQLAAATARVGEATADLFPKFSITGALGFDSTKPKHLLDWNSRYWSLAPGFSWPIFDAGRIRANIDVQNEVQKQAMSNYQETVLNALKDVEDSLASYRTEQLRRQALADATAAAHQAVDLAKQQYNQGLVDFLTVLDAERAEFATESSLAQSDRAISTDLVALYKALGGGWEITVNQ